MNLNEQINRAAERATDAQLYEAFATLQRHVRYREDLQEYAKKGGRLSHPAWASPGQKRGGHWR